MRFRTLRAVAIAAALVSVTPALARAHVAHTVQSGESLWSIAAANGIGVGALAAANGLPADASLISGTTISVPEADAAAVTGSGACVWRCQSPAHPHPSDEAVSPELVHEVAAEHGMSGSLVEAIALEESGLSNAAVSSAGARGVMQIIPATWRFVEDQLLGRPLPAASARSNVEAGAIYLHHLYHRTGGDREATIASYYQGPNRDTILSESRRYVEGVDATQRSLTTSGY